MHWAKTHLNPCLNRPKTVYIGNKHKYANFHGDSNICTDSTINQRSTVGRSSPYKPNKKGSVLSLPFFSSFTKKGNPPLINPYKWKEFRTTPNSES